MVNKIFKHRMEDPEPLERVARGVPAAFAAIVRKLMSKDPEDRYQSCQELSIDLARWTDPERVRGARGGRGRVAPDIPPAPSRARGRRPPPPDRRRRSQLARHLVAFPRRCRARRGAHPPSRPPPPGPASGVPRTTRVTPPPPPPAGAGPPGRVALARPVHHRGRRPGALLHPDHHDLRLRESFGPAFALYLLRAAHVGENDSKTERSGPSDVLATRLSCFEKWHAPPGDIVEIGLLLPANRADALVELSRRRHQSVSQFLRGLIDHALTDEVLRRP